jgi:hypothetical protein
MRGVTMKGFASSSFAPRNSARCIRQPIKHLTE